MYVCTRTNNIYSYYMYVLYFISFFMMKPRHFMLISHIVLVFNVNKLPSDPKARHSLSSTRNVMNDGFWTPYICTYLYREHSETECGVSNQKLLAHGNVVRVVNLYSEYIFNIIKKTILEWTHRCVRIETGTHPSFLHDNDDNDTDNND
jgi:hypothetical protein